MKTRDIILAIVSVTLLFLIINRCVDTWEYYDAPTGKYEVDPYSNRKLDSFPRIEYEYAEISEESGDTAYSFHFSGDNDIANPLFYGTGIGGYYISYGTSRAERVLGSEHIYWEHRWVESTIYVPITTRKLRREK